MTTVLKVQCVGIAYIEFKTERQRDGTGGSGSSLDATRPDVHVHTVAKVVDSLGFSPVGLDFLHPGNASIDGSEFCDSCHISRK